MNLVYTLIYLCFTYVFCPHQDSPSYLKISFPNKFCASLTESDYRYFASNGQPRNLLFLNQLNRKNGRRNVFVEPGITPSAMQFTLPKYPRAGLVFGFDKTH